MEEGPVVLATEWLLSSHQFDLSKPHAFIPPLPQGLNSPFLTCTIVTSLHVTYLLVGHIQWIILENMPNS